MFEDGQLHHNEANSTCVTLLKIVSLGSSLLREGSGSSRDVAVEQEVHQPQHQYIQVPKYIQVSQYIYLPLYILIPLNSQQTFHDDILQQEAVNTVAAPVYYPSPNVSRPASQLTEEEQVTIY